MNAVVLMNVFISSSDDVSKAPGFVTSYLSGISLISVYLSMINVVGHQSSEDTRVFYRIIGRLA